MSIKLENYTEEGGIIFSIKNHKIASNAFLNVIKQICTLVFSLITFPYVSRILGDNNYGKYSFATAIIEYLLLFSMLGGGTYAIREGSYIRDDKKKLKIFSSQMFTIGFFSTALAYLTLIVLCIVCPNLQDYKNILFVLSFRILASFIGVEWIFIIFEDYLNITIRQIIVQTIGLILTFLLVKKSDDIIWYAVATVIAMSSANLVNFFISQKYIKVSFTKNMALSKHIKSMIMILLYSAMISIYSNSDIIILGIMTDDSTVGIYSVAAKIYGISKNIFIAALTVLLPRISYYIGTVQETKVKKIINKTLESLLVFLIPFIILLIYYSKTFIFFISGESYISGQRPLQLLSVALIFAIISSLLTTNTMIPLRKEKQITFLVIISAIANILFNIVLIPLYKANAAAVTTIIAEIIVCVGAMISSRNFIHINSLFKLCFKISICSSIMIFVLFSVSSLFKNILAEFISGTILSMTCYTLTTLLVNKQYRNTILTFLIDYKNKFND